MCENNEQLSAEVNGRTTIRARLLARGYSVAAWARARGVAHEEQVHAMLSSRRAYPEIRDMLAADLGLTREQFDEVIPLPTADAA